MERMTRRFELLFGSIMGISVSLLLLSALLLAR